MLKGEYWLISCPERKLSLQFTSWKEPNKKTHHSST
jgi:hypothetical protein